VGHVPRSAGLGSASIHFFSHLNTVFKKKVNPKYAKNACFLEKSCKNRHSSPIGRVVTPANCYSSLSSAYLVLKLVLI